MDCDAPCCSVTALVRLGRFYCWLAQELAEARAVRQVEDAQVAADMKRFCGVDELGDDSGEGRHTRVLDPWLTLVAARCHLLPAAPPPHTPPLSALL